MPYIHVQLTKTLVPQQKSELKTELGKAITLFPGKSEAYLMCSIQDNQTMFFQGKDGDTAFVEVKLFGGVDENAAEKFTAQVCRVMEKFGIPANRVYVRYEGGNLWGFNGFNF